MAKNPTFKSVTILIMAANETSLLRQTVKEIRNNCSDEDLEKIIVYCKDDSCSSFFEAQKIIEEYNDGKIEIYLQTAENMAYAVAEMPTLVESTHFVMMGADMEMNPANIRDFVEKAKKHPERIICASKWHKDSTVSGYSAVRRFFSKALNKFLSFVIGRKADEPLSLFQIYPTSVYRKMNFEEPIKVFFEYTLKPLRYGIEYEEIATEYNQRPTGNTSFKGFMLVSVAIELCITAIKLRFTPKRDLNEQ